MTDSGKHSALRQTDDGSFELVLDREGLQEVSEEEVSFAEVTVPEPSPAAPASSRVLIFSVVGVVALLAATAIGWFALSPGESKNDEPSEVAGFKPYVGGAESNGAAKQNAARKARIAAIAEATDPEEVVEEDTVEEVAEIAEDEPGWELSEQAEDGVFVEVEGTDDELAEAEADAEAGDNGLQPASPAIMSQKRLDTLRRGNIGRTIQTPRMPKLGGTNPITAKLPIRNLRPAPTGEDDGDGEVEVEVEVEVDPESESESDGEEEIVEDEEVEDEELQ